jgi:hypothetical protein
MRHGVAVREASVVRIDCIAACARCVLAVLVRCVCVVCGAESARAGAPSATCV